MIRLLMSDKPCGSSAKPLVVLLLSCVLAAMPHVGMAQDTPEESASGVEPAADEPVTEEAGGTEPETPGTPPDRRRNPFKRLGPQPLTPEQREEAERRERERAEKALAEARRKRDAAEQQKRIRAEKEQQARQKQEQAERQKAEALQEAEREEEAEREKTKEALQESERQRDAAAKATESQERGTASKQAQAEGEKTKEESKPREGLRGMLSNRVDRRSACRQQAEERGLTGRKASRYTRLCVSGLPIPKTLSR